MTEPGAQDTDTTQDTSEAQDSTQVTTQDTGEAQDTSEDTKQNTFDRAYVEQLRKEAAEYRTKAKRLEDAEKKRKNAELSETERLKTEKEQAETKATQAETRANERIINAEARVQALESGTKPDRVSALLRLADLSDVEVGDDGEPDAKAIKKTLEAALKEYPEFKAGAGVLKDGFNPGGKPDTGKQDIDAQIAKAEKDGDARLSVMLKGQKKYGQVS